MSNKQIIYTDAATKRLNELHDKLKADIEDELRERKNVPGDETVEVTGSDVDDLANSMRLSFFERQQARLLMRDLIVKMYLAIGILTLAAGLLYPYLRTVADNPIQLSLLGTGLLMSAASYMMHVLLKRREAMRRMEEFGEYRRSESKRQEDITNR